jgi:ribose-phosphate pyrophosphokinase
VSGAALFCFAETTEQAARLAQALGIPCHAIAVHRFPDGESLVRVDPAPSTALLYRSLDKPNAKLVELILAASALRGNGARRVILIAPCLAYMRQDQAFHRGEAVSQRVIGRLLAERFDALLTVDPHLHRTPSLASVVPGIEVAVLSAAAELSAALDPNDRPLLVGPDGESRQWLQAVASLNGLDVLLGDKRRDGDRVLAIHFPEIERCRSRNVVLVDDLVSTGATMIEAAALLHRAGAARIDALATHCLAGPDELRGLARAGISSVRATDSVPGPAATLPLASLIADEVRRRGWSEV